MLRKNTCNFVHLTLNSTKNVFHFFRIIYTLVYGQVLLFYFSFKNSVTGSGKDKQFSWYVINCKIKILGKRKKGSVSRSVFMENHEIAAGIRK